MRRAVRMVSPELERRKVAYFHKRVRLNLKNAMDIYANWRRKVSGDLKSDSVEDLRELLSDVHVNFVVISSSLALTHAEKGLVEWVSQEVADLMNISNYKPSDDQSALLERMYQLCRIDGVVLRLDLRVMDILEAFNGK